MARFSQIGRMAEKEAGLLPRLIDTIAPGGSEPGPAEALGMKPTLFPSEDSNGERETEKTHGQEMSAEHRILAKASQQTAERADGHNH